LTVALPATVLGNDTDVDGDALTAVLGAGPSTGTLTLNANGTFTYTPNAQFNGTDSFTYRAKDATLESNLATVTITVAAANDAPVLSAIGSKTVAENDTLTFTVSATDADGDALTYSAAPLPSGASFDPVTRIFAWRPGYTQAGRYTVTFAVRDASESTGSEAISVEVTDTNRAPVVTNPGSQTGIETSAVSLPIAATDADGDPLTYSATGLPAGLAISPSTGLISGTLAAGTAGTHTVTVTVNDGKGATPSVTFTWTVNGATVSTTTTLSSPTPNPTTYGQDVVLNASVARVGGGGAPTGSIDFLDGNGLLASVTLVNGTASLTTKAISAGTPTTVRAVYKPASGFTGSEATIARTVNKATATGTFLTLSPIQKQYSDRVLMEATMSASSPSDTVTFQIGTTVLATVPVVNGKATANPQMLFAPGSRIVTAVFNSPNYTVANANKSMSIIKEDARVAYAGTPGETLCLCGNTTIAVRVNVSDISAIDPALDPDAGNIGTATVTFTNRGTLTTYGTVTVTPNADGKTGVATYNFPASALGTATSQTITFGVIVSGNYNRNNTADNFTITIKK
jgi:VCBS repeat-containing protein